MRPSRHRQVPRGLRPNPRLMIGPRVRARLASGMLVLWASVLLVACQTSANKAAGTITVPPPVPALAGIKTPPTLEEAPPIKFEQGECALVLWTKSQPPRRVFAALNNPNRATIRIEGKKIDLIQTDQEGDPAFGFSPRAVYEGGGLKLRIDLIFDTRENLNAGVLGVGTIEMTNAEGWSSLTPVGGILACNG